ncbi:kinesin [Leishmania donovani]|uniref:Kinesin motor domain family protein n=1 Tax=Leishmania donovani TaxID=5661 RepID=A0A504YBX3_LEIDO|nr:Kinesin motor domain family protein [Leishmania donovani]CAJ1988105.1 kinesin [Leishmania donovani]VDZ43992.1 kinesin_putative/GeneDB:LmjF.18.1600 [Leishmania donovani]
MSQRRVEVAVRVRPDTESRHNSCVSLNHATRHISAQDDTGANALTGRRSYKEDFLFDEHVSNRAVFEELVLQKMRAATPEHPDTLCFLAYGHTSSGKTYTIAGSEQEPGILALCVEELLRGEGVVEVAMLEVYLESVNDLLAHGEPRHIRRRQGMQGPVIVVEGLTTCSLTSVEQWNAVAAYGMSSRRTAPTERNPRSSRSHAIFTIKSRGVRLCFVDLAGSERQTVFSPQLNKESISINKSLSRLSTVLEALSNQRIAHDGTRSYVNFRDTTLTVLLQRYLTGASMTTFLACVHPSADYYQETLSTLRYTQRLKRIRTRVTKVDEGEWSGMRVSEHQVLLDELNRLREQMKVSENVTKLVEATHRRRIAELEHTLAKQGGSHDGAAGASAPLSSAPREMNARRARDTRRVAGWLLSRVLGDLPELNVGYDDYFDAYFPPSVQVIGYVSAMASLVPRIASDDPLAFLDVGDLAMGLSMLDAGVPPFVRLHKSVCSDPSSWEGCEWDGTQNMVYVLAFFEYHPTAMSSAAAGDAAGMEEALPCCGGYTTSAPLLPIATVLCVAASTTRRVKEEVLQRLVDLQCEQHEAVAEQAKTGARSPSLSSTMLSSRQAGFPSAASLLDASDMRNVSEAESDDDASASTGSTSGGALLALEARCQAADTPHIATPFQEEEGSASGGCSCDSCEEARAAMRSAEVHRHLAGELTSPSRPSAPPPRARNAEESTKVRGCTAAAVSSPLLMPATCKSFSPLRPSGTSSAPLPPADEFPPGHTSKRRNRTAGEGKTVKMQSCQGCRSM